MFLWEYGEQKLDENLTNGLEQAVDNLLGGQYASADEDFDQSSGSKIQNGFAELQDTFIDTVLNQAGVTESANGDSSASNIAARQETGFLNSVISHGSERIEDNTAEAFRKNMCNLQECFFCCFHPIAENL